MKAAPLPQNEDERLAELLSYDVLDTEAEQLFDDLTALASQICETPLRCGEGTRPQGWAQAVFRSGSPYR